MEKMYETRRAMPQSRTSEELLRRRWDRERHERMTRRRRAWVFRIILIGLSLFLITLEMVHADIIVAGSAIWACIPGE